MRATRRGEGDRHGSDMYRNNSRQRHNPQKEQHQQSPKPPTTIWRIALTGNDSHKTASIFCPFFRHTLNPSPYARQPCGRKRNRRSSPSASVILGNRGMDQKQSRAPRGLLRMQTLQARSTLQRQKLHTTPKETDMYQKAASPTMILPLQRVTIVPRASTSPILCHSIEIYTVSTLF